MARSFKYEVGEELAYRNTVGGNWFKDGEKVEVIEVDTECTGPMVYRVVGGRRSLTRWVTEGELEVIPKKNHKEGNADMTRTLKLGERVLSEHLGKGVVVEKDIGCEVGLEYRIKLSGYEDKKRWARRSTLTPLNEFEVGERVKHTGYGEGIILETDIGCITRLEYKVGKDGGDSRYFWAPGAALTLLEDQEVSKKGFKRGDSVLFTGERGGTQYKNEMYYVLENDGTDYKPIRLTKSLDSDSRADFFWAEEEEVRLINEETKKILEEIKSLGERFDDKLSELKEKVLEEGEAIGAEEDETEDVTLEVDNTPRIKAIQEARKFVTDTRDKAFRYGHETIPEANSHYNDFVTKTEFRVDEDNGTVRVIVRNRYGDAIRTSANFKCPPGKVFNADIGKAVALILVYGLPMVESFINPPQPSEVVPGMTVKCSDEAFGDASGETTKVVEEEQGVIGGERGFLVDVYNEYRKDTLTWVNVRDLEVISDTEADYEEVASN